MINWPNNKYWKQMYGVYSERETFDINCISSINNPRNNSLLFIKDITPNIIDKLTTIQESIIITKQIDQSEIKQLLSTNGVIFDENPRYCFASILQPLWNAISVRKKLIWNANFQVFMGENVIISENVNLEPNVTIGENSIIGENVFIMAGAKIGPNVIIGSNSVIRENVVIGGWGFGFAEDKNGQTIRLPHIGGVVIGTNVEVGALTTICSGTIDPTVIEENVKIDDHVHIAHNCVIGKNTIITACAEISGSVKIGENCWVAPNASVINGIEIGNNSTLGIGSVILKPVESNSVIVGNPGKMIRENNT